MVDHEILNEQAVNLGLVGEILFIYSEILNLFTQNHYIFIISPIDIDNYCNTLNLNANTMAGVVVN